MTHVVLNEFIFILGRYNIIVNIRNFQINMHSIVMI